MWASSTSLSWRRTAMPSLGNARYECELTVRGERAGHQDPVGDARPVAPGITHRGTTQCLLTAEAQSKFTPIWAYMVEYPTKQLNFSTLPLCRYQKSAVGTSIFAPFGLTVPAGDCSGPRTCPGSTARC